MPTLPLVLSSTSPARQMLLKRLQLPFVINAPNIDETPHPNESAVALVKRLAQEKAQVCTAKFPNALIIGCDQVAVMGNEIVSKPETHKKAVEQLQFASGKCIEFFTGLCLFNSLSQTSQITVETYRVFYRVLTLEMIEHYLHKEKPYQCAGSIRVEGLGISLLERLEGQDPTALTGLPLIQLVKMLEQEGVKVL